jgi:hypothetical protein
MICGFDQRRVRLLCLGWLIGNERIVVDSSSCDRWWWCYPGIEFFTQSARPSHCLMEDGSIYLGSNPVSKTTCLVAARKDRHGTVAGEVGARLMTQRSAKE